MSMKFYQLIILIDLGVRWRNHPHAVLAYTMDDSAIKVPSFYNFEFPFNYSHV